MARADVLTVLHPPREVDYVATFQQLADTTLAMRREGASYERMVRRGVLEADLGNYDASRQTAYDAALMRHDPLEALFLRGSSALLQALTRLDVLEAKVPDPGTLPVRTLLEDAQQAFHDVVRIDPTDKDAQMLAETCDDWLDNGGNLPHYVRAQLNRRPPRPAPQ